MHSCRVQRPLRRRRRRRCWRLSRELDRSSDIADDIFSKFERPVLILNSGERTGLVIINAIRYIFHVIKARSLARARPNYQYKKKKK
ncbi:hypothetical protein PUN28_010616 [Cardiocondyla obscurior]|uniref:Uncharacterized protein n=1 Tax=Cardiocondyla obscurior TaxID=286306 RepID=A0AAW2FMD8_9HYME